MDLLEDTQIVNCLTVKCVRIDQKDWECPNCGSKPVIFILDGGSAQCSNKTCNVDKYHFCGMTGKYNTTGSPFHRVEEETS